MINPSAVRLQLPNTTRFNSTLWVSQFKPGLSSPSCPALSLYPPTHPDQWWWFDFIIGCVHLWHLGPSGFHYFEEWEGDSLKSCLSRILQMLASLGIFTRLLQTSLAGCPVSVGGGATFRDLSLSLFPYVLCCLSLSYVKGCSPVWFHSVSAWVLFCPPASTPSVSFHLTPWIGSLNISI